MLLIRWLRWLRGYVCFAASEGFPERLLNLCAQKGVALWDVCVREGVLYGRTDIAGYKAMHACAKQAGARLKIKEKHGLRFFMHKYRRRVGLLIGLGIFVILLSALSGMVWSIEVEGNQTVPSETILAAFESQGLRPGIPRKSVNTRAMGENAQKNLPQLAWLSLNIQGSTAVIEVREVFNQLEEEAGVAAPQNIVAARAGQLRLLEVYEGLPQAKTGQALLRGALLAGGVLENKDGSVRFAHAEAYAVARVSFGLDAAPDATPPGSQVTLETTHRTLCFLWFRIPLGPRPKLGANDVTLCSKETLYAGEKPLPAAVERLTVLRLTKEKRTLNQRQWRLVAAQELFEQAYRLLRGVQVLEQEAFLRSGQEGVRAVWRGAAYQNIGEAAAITADS
jgi:similar to stage IV sporulation protein